MFILGPPNSGGNSKHFGQSTNKSTADYTRSNKGFKEKDDTQNNKPEEQDAEKNDNPFLLNSTRLRAKRASAIKLDYALLKNVKHASNFPGYAVYEDTPISETGWDDTQDSGGDTDTGNDIPTGSVYTYTVADSLLYLDSYRGDSTQQEPTAFPETQPTWSDDFEDASIAAKWNRLDFFGSATVTESDGSLNYSVSGGNLTIYQQLNVPLGYRFTTKITLGGTDPVNMAAGLVFTKNTFDMATDLNFAYLELRRRTSDTKIEAGETTTMASFTTSAATYATEGLDVVYFQLYISEAGEVSYYYSIDNLTWYELSRPTDENLIDMTGVTGINVGVLCGDMGGGSATGTLTASYEYFLEGPEYTIATTQAALTLDEDFDTDLNSDWDLVSLGHLRALLAKDSTFSNYVLRNIIKVTTAYIPATGGSFTMMLSPNGSESTTNMKTIYTYNGITGSLNRVDTTSSVESVGDSVSLGDAETFYIANLVIDSRDTNYVGPKAYYSIDGYTWTMLPEPSVIQTFNVDTYSLDLIATSNDETESAVFAIDYIKDIENKDLYEDVYSITLSPDNAGDPWYQSYVDPNDNSYYTGIERDLNGGGRWIIGINTVGGESGSTQLQRGIYREITTPFFYPIVSVLYNSFEDWITYPVMRPEPGNYSYYAIGKGTYTNGVYYGDDDGVALIWKYTESGMELIRYDKDGTNTSTNVLTFDEDYFYVDNDGTTELALVVSIGINQDGTVLTQYGLYDTAGVTFTNIASGSTSCTFTSTDSCYLNTGIYRGTTDSLDHAPELGIGFFRFRDFSSWTNFVERF